jgi:ABC-type bacteriocin/lantibiotic exporter with double-glycine peptidase domain
LSPLAGTRRGRRALTAASLAFVLYAPGTICTAGRTGPESLHLDVPLVSQEKELCGAASLAMVFKYWGQEISQYTIADAIGREDGKGLRGEDLRDFSERSGFSAFLFEGELDGVKGHLQKGRPVVVAIRSKRARLYHYIVLVGFDDASAVILANDPRDGKLVRIAYKKFLTLWGRSKAWSLLIVPK